jgi:hydroxymethylbilane synthase
VRTKIVVGCRGSKLALIQAKSVMAKIKKVNPYLEVNIRKIVTKSDHHHHTRLDQITSVGVFVRELEEALLGGRIDLAVHSLKDMPTQINHGLCLVAVTQRLDPRDVLISKSRLDELAPGSRIGTGSLRRAVQLVSYRPDLEVCSIRGNVDTRLRKVFCEKIDGVILAAAAMARLGWEDKISEYLPLDHFLPAVGQGALAVETRLGDEELAELVLSINHLPTWQSITAERAFLSALGGGCRAPIAALGIASGTTLDLEGMIADVSGKKILRALEKGSVTLPEEVGVRLAQKILGMGASEFITEARVR